MKLLKSKIFVSAAIFGAGLFSSGDVITSVQAKELKLAYFMSPKHHMNRNAFTPFAQHVKKESGGDLTVKLFPAGQLGKGPVAQYKRAIEGVADITFIIQGYTATIFPRTVLLNAPGVGKSAEEITKKAWAIFDDHLAVEYKKVKLLGLWANSPTSLITKKKINSIADLKGLKVRTPPGDFAGALYASWGAVPVALPISKTFNSFNTGVVNAVAVGAAALYSPWNLGGPGTHVLDNVPGLGSAFGMIMNPKTWDGLNSKQKAAVNSIAGTKFSMMGASSFGNDDRKGLVRAKAGEGVTFSDVPESATGAFQAGVKTVVDKVIADLQSRGISDAREIYTKLSK
jgi:TRAP-type transport system periplasmic protein